MNADYTIFVVDWSCIFISNLLAEYFLLNIKYNTEKVYLFVRKENQLMTTAITKIQLQLPTYLAGHHHAQIIYVFVEYNPN